MAEKNRFKSVIRDGLHYRGSENVSVYATLVLLVKNMIRAGGDERASSCLLIIKYNRTNLTA